jgi:CubicO group peptidase (beta-lactamase class C family)
VALLLSLTSMISEVRAEENRATRDVADTLALTNAQIYLSGENLPAYAAAVLHCGVNRFRSGGRVRIDRRNTTTPDSRFNIGGNAKSMLASVAARYVDRGLLEFDATIAELWPAAGQVAPDKGTITLEQLLAHRSGLPAFTTLSDLARVPGFSGTASDVRRQAAMWLLEQPLEVDPGSTTLYSNAGYVVAGVLLARVSGRSLEMMLREELFEPLGLNAQLGSAESVEEPFGHYLEADRVRVNLSLEPQIPTFLDAAGNISLSAPDYAAYLQVHLCGLQGIETGYLRARTVQRLHVPSGEGTASLGWSQADIAGTKTSFQVGASENFTAFAALAPDLDIAVLAMLNIGGEVAAPGSTWIVETVSQAAQRQNPQREEAVVPQADALE